MSVASELERLRTNITNTYTALRGKGATIPTNQNADNLASTVNTLDINDSANVINAVNHTGTTLTKGTKVWISLRNPNTQAIDGYYIVNYADIDNTCYTAVTSANCSPLSSVDVFTVLDTNTMTAADNGDFYYEVIE